MKKTIASALTVAVLAGSAMFASTSASQAGYYGGHYGYNNYYGGYHCFYKKVKVWGYYGYHWKRIKVCG